MRLARFKLFEQFNRRGERLSECELVSTEHDLVHVVSMNPRLAADQISPSPTDELGHVFEAYRPPVSRIPTRALAIAAILHICQLLFRPRRLVRVSVHEIAEQIRLQRLPVCLNVRIRGVRHVFIESRRSHKLLLLPNVQLVESTPKQLQLVIHEPPSVFLVSTRRQPQ